MLTRSRHRWVVAAALCCVAVSCGNMESSSDDASVTPTTIGTVETNSPESVENVGEDTTSSDDDDDDGTFDPGYWLYKPQWWREVEEIYELNPDLLGANQHTQWVETPPGDAEASEMHLGDRVLMWRIPVDWEEVCISHGCVYAWAEAELGTLGYVAGWGGEKGRTWSGPPGEGSGPGYQGHHYSGRPRTYVAGDTQPLGCEPNKEKSDPYAVDLYPEPWFVACVGTIDEFTIARVEMFRLNDDCEPYGNSHGAWISWEWASATNINKFVTSLAIQMLADSIECVALETLLSTAYESGAVWGPDEELHKIWVSELQRRIGADVDGFYGPKTRDLHFRATVNIDDYPHNISLVSATPCGTFKMLSGEQHWEALEGLVVKWDRYEETWLFDTAELEPPGKIEAQGWWEDFRNEKNSYPEFSHYPPHPDHIYTADVTGDGANDFIMQWPGSIQSQTAIATNHKRSATCEPWRYIRTPNEIHLALFPTDHDVWLAAAKTFRDAQGNRCWSPGWNTSYVRYDPVKDGFVTTMCKYYPRPEANED